MTLSSEVTIWTKTEIVLNVEEKKLLQAGRAWFMVIWLDEEHVEYFTADSSFKDLTLDWHWFSSTVGRSLKLIDKCF